MKKHILIAMVALVLILLPSCKNEIEIPQDFKDLINLSNVTLEVKEPSNTYIIRYENKDSIYKVDNGITTKVTSSNVAFITNLVKVYDSFTYEKIEEEEKKPGEGKKSIEEFVTKGYY